MNPDLEDAGTLVTAGLAAHEIDQGSVPRHGPAEADHRCGNCGATLTGAYCQACGQSAHLHHSLLHLAEEVLHGVMHFDAKGWRTLPLLIAQPGRLTRRYIDGQRTRYVSPLALFLFTVFLMFFVFSMAGAPTVEHGTPQERARTAADLSQERARAAAEVARAGAVLEKAQLRGNSEGIAEAKDSLADAQADRRAIDRAAAVVDALGAGEHPVADWKQQLANLPIHTGLPAIDTRLHEHLQNPDLFLYQLKNTAYKLSFMLIPISLPFLWLLFIGRRVPMYDHAVFSLYSLSFMSLLFIIAALLSAAGVNTLVALLVLVAPPVHLFLQVRGAYGLGIFAAAWRAVALLVVAGTAFLLFLLFIVMMTLH